MKSIFEQTLEHIEKRANFFKNTGRTAQNGIFANSSMPVHTISQSIAQIRCLNLIQTPVHPNLVDMYLSEQNKNQLKFILPPPSQGQDSINQQQNFDPSFKWISSSLIDSTLLQVDQIQAKKTQRFNIPEEWKNVLELLIYNVTTNISLKSEIKQIESRLKRKFQRFAWIKFKRVKQIFYKGKPSLILKFGDQNSAIFAYYNFASKVNRQDYGPNTEVFRVTQNKLKNIGKSNKWIALVFRKLPNTMTKQQFLNIFKGGVSPIWVEDLIQIAGSKYTLCKVNFLDDALYLCSVFQSKKIRDAKVNLHPKSTRRWSTDEFIG